MKVYIGGNDCKELNSDKLKKHPSIYPRGKDNDTQSHIDTKDPAFILEKNHHVHRSTRSIYHKDRVKAQNSV